MLHATWIAIFSINPFTSDFDMKKISVPSTSRLNFGEKKTNIVFNFVFSSQLLQTFFSKMGFLFLPRNIFLTELDEDWLKIEIDFLPDRKREKLNKKRDFSGFS